MYSPASKASEKSPCQVQVTFCAKTRQGTWPPQMSLVNPLVFLSGKIKRESLNFNLTSLSGEENVSQAEIHIFRKKSGHGKLPRMKFYVAHHRKRRNFGGGRKMTGDTSPLPPGRGWKKVDVTEIIKTSFRQSLSLSLSVIIHFPDT